MTSHESDTDAAAKTPDTHFSLQDPTERDAKLLISSRNADWQLRRFYSATNEGEIVIINIQIYCFSLSRNP